jgi:thymidine kinase
MNYDNARIEIILGCMFSGKSTELLRRISRYEAIGYPILLINHIYDVRTDDSIQTHGKIKKNALKLSALMSCTETNDFINARVIGIDESQFFNDLLEFALYCEKMGKILIISGLNGDSNRRPFGHILECIPLADEVTLLHAMDMIDKNGSFAFFSKKISNSNQNNDSQIDIGAADKYLAVSRKNYFNNSI